MLNSTKNILQVVLNQRFSKIFVFGLFLIFTLTACSNLKFRTTKKEILTDFRSKKVEHQHTGFLVVDMVKKDTLFNINGSKYFTPASTTKLFTLYTSLQLLDKNIPVLKHMKSENSTHVLPTGDPTWLHPYFKDSTALSFLKNQDSIVLHLGNYQGEKYGPGWAWEDYPYYFSPEISSVPLYGNVVSIESNDSLVIFPKYFRKVTERKDSMPLRKWRENRFYLKKRTQDTLQIPFITSDTLTLELLEDAIGSRITIGQTIPDADWNILYGVPIDSLLQRMLVESDNFLAEQLMLLASSTLSDTLNFSRAKQHILDNQLKDLKEVPRWVDGSGLSRYNLFTPKSMVQVLDRLFMETDSTRLFRLIPKWDADGTISNNAPLLKNAFIHAKSGSMGNMYNLSGYLKTKSGKLLVFSFMNNHFRKPTSTVRKHMYNTLMLIHENY